MKPIFDATVLTPEQAREAIAEWKRNNPGIVAAWDAAYDTPSARLSIGYRPPKRHDDSYDPAHSGVRNFPCSVVPLSITMEPDPVRDSAPQVLRSVGRFSLEDPPHCHSSSDAIRPGVTVRYDTEASLVEGALRDNLKSLGWVTPGHAIRAREALGRAVVSNNPAFVAEQLAIALDLLKA